MRFVLLFVVVVTWAFVNIKFVAAQCACNADLMRQIAVSVWIHQKYLILDFTS